MQTLRPYQIATFAEQQRLARQHRRLLVVLPTGGGKTTVAVHNIKSAVSKGYKVLFVAHRTELIEQCAQRLGDIEHGIIKAGHPARLDRPVQVASVQTLIKRPYWGGEKMLVYRDEAHRRAAATDEQVFARYEHAYHVGLTATPYRLDGKGLGGYYDAIVECVTPGDLIDSGFLVDPTVYAAPEPDMKGVRKRAGEYVAADLQDGCTKLVGEVVPTWRKRAEGLSTIVFAVDRAHSQRIVEAFTEAGVPAMHIDGTTPPKIRRRALRRLATGELLVISNCDLLTEGFDGASYCPEGETYRPLACLIAARPTASMGLWFQMVGRITRPGKAEAIVLDHGGNTTRHGFLRDHHSFTLDGEVQGKKIKGFNPPPMKRCTGCAAMVPAGAATCEECGEPFEGAREVEHVEGELVQLERKVNTTATPEQKVDEYRRLLRVTQKKNFKTGWADYRFEETYGHRPAPVMKAQVFRELGIKPRSFWQERGQQLPRIKPVAPTAITTREDYPWDDQ